MASILQTLYIWPCAVQLENKGCFRTHSEHDNMGVPTKVINQYILHFFQYCKFKHSQNVRLTFTFSNHMMLRGHVSIHTESLSKS